MSGHWLWLHVLASASKLPASKVQAAESIPGPALHVEPPLAFENDERLLRPISESHVVDGRVIAMREMHAELQLTYIHGSVRTSTPNAPWHSWVSALADLVSSGEIESLVQMADTRNGWVRSPLKRQRSGSCVDDEEQHRTSSSCPST